MHKSSLTAIATVLSTYGYLAAAQSVSGSGQPSEPSRPTANVVTFYADGPLPSTTRPPGALRSIEPADVVNAAVKVQGEIVSVSAFAVDPEEGATYYAGLHRYSVVPATTEGRLVSVTLPAPKFEAVTFLADASRFHLVANGAGVADGVRAGADVELDCEHSDSDPAQDGPDTIVCKKRLGFHAQGNGERVGTTIKVTTTGVPMAVATVTLAEEGSFPTTREARYSEAAEEAKSEEGAGWGVTPGGWLAMGVSVVVLSQLW
ncbi:hypothetical protein BKA70DRAFT_1428390 [Coprinopsis sp. MPI-PUGE-AT-0042]|nr:hypothetical protein BKA70DRAFT_1428390 [Coprinopsis sp. MPI-PUGE-AT-0042]